MSLLTTVVLASHNSGKVRELESLLAASVQVKSLADFDPMPPEETGNTFHENAALKARLCYEKTGLPSLADDSGLCIEALQGAPGLYSHRFMESHGGDVQTFKFLAEHKDIQVNPKAYFMCVLALALSQSDIRFYEGRCYGTLVFPPQTGGFGYDPIFMPKGSEKTFSEMSLSEKARFSHRGQALRTFLQECC